MATKYLVIAAICVGLNRVHKYGEVVDGGSLENEAAEVKGKFIRPLTDEELAAYNEKRGITADGAKTDPLAPPAPVLEILKTKKVVVTQELLDGRPDLVEKGVKVDDTIDEPLTAEEISAAEEEAKKAAAKKAAAEKKAAEEKKAEAKKTADAMNARKGK